ncbi:MAG: TVP38/TMEM64 family protein [Planctomycetota bacterium]
MTDTASPDDNESKNPSTGNAHASAGNAQASVGDNHRGAKQYRREFVLVAVVLLIVAARYFFGDALSIANLAEHESGLRSASDESPLLFWVAAFFLYVLVTGMSLPGAAVMTLTYAWFFGFGSALLLVSFASTSGATIAFLTSRFLLRDWVTERLGDRVDGFNRRLESEGPFYLFTLRLIVGVPFVLINLAMGLTPIRTRTFWWVSQLGMLPGTAAYVYAGSTVPSLESLQKNGIGEVFSLPLIFAFAIIGVLPLASRFIIAKLRG